MTLDTPERRVIQDRPEYLVCQERMESPVHLVNQVRKETQVFLVSPAVLGILETKEALEKWDTQVLWVRRVLKALWAQRVTQGSWVQRG